MAMASKRSIVAVLTVGIVWMLADLAAATVVGQQKISETSGNFSGVLNADYFGQSLAYLGDVDGDGVGDIAVGASSDDTGGANRGAVWIIFMMADGTVKSELKIADATGGFTGTLDNGDGFGTALAALGDWDSDGVTELAVTATLDDDGATDAGALWILFLDTNGTVKSQQKISNTAGGFTGPISASSEFGWSVENLGDLDTNGTNDVAVGVVLDDDGGSGRGAVWVIFLNNTAGTVTVVNEQKISDTAGGFGGVLSNGDGFGMSLELIDDLDSNGVPELAVGAGFDDDGGTGRGAVWILFLDSTGNVIAESKISSTQGGFTGALDNADEFGRSIAAIGDLDGNGVTDIAVGANFDDDGGADFGAVWVLCLNGDGAVLGSEKFSQTEGGFGGALDADGRFGTSITPLGDFNNDGHADLAVGNPRLDDGGTDQGAFWLVYHWGKTPPPDPPSVISLFVDPGSDALCPVTPPPSTLLADFDFEGGGGCDLQGWVVHDFSGRHASYPLPAEAPNVYPGIMVFQEDPCIANATCLWGFFDDPIMTPYDCHTPAAVPAQGALPYFDVRYIYLNDEIWSPPVDITAGSGPAYTLEFDVYRDLPIDNLIFYHWKIRSIVGGNPGPWTGDGVDYSGDQRDWYTQVHDIGHLIEPGATEIQIALGVIDYAEILAGILGTGACHSHSPLFDNVRVRRLGGCPIQYSVNNAHLFQDNFAADGTTTGTVRADMAQDIRPMDQLAILPGDSIAIGVSEAVNGLAADPITGVGPAVYCYVSVRPTGQPGKAAANIESPHTRIPIGKRFPHVGSVAAGGFTWECFRMDTVFTPDGTPVPTRFCFDLNDAVFTPPDEIYFFFGAENAVGDKCYWNEFVGTVPGIPYIFTCPSEMEFSCLPGQGWQNGGDVLYVDDFDGHGAQPRFEDAFVSMAIEDQVDRFDVRAPESRVGNGLGSRVVSTQNQLIPCYRKIVWNSGDLPEGLIGAGEITQEKSNDFGILYDFLDLHPDRPGLYISGDNVAAEWVGLTAPDAVALRTVYANYNLVTDDHVLIGEPVTPCLIGSGPCFSFDQLIAQGSCPGREKFDVLSPVGLSVTEVENSVTSEVYTISQSTANGASSTARVILAGFSFHHIQNKIPSPPGAHKVYLYNALTWLENVVPYPTGVNPTPTFENELGYAYPNPFNPTTLIRYNVEGETHVALRIYDVAGKLVRTLVNGVKSPAAGGHVVEWDGKDDYGTAVASGVYLYRLETGHFEEVRKVVLLK